MNRPTPCSQVQSAEVPPGDYLFGIYRWQKQGVKADEALVPVASASGPGRQAAHAAPDRDDARRRDAAGRTPSSTRWMPRHHAKWRDAQANHIADNRQQVEHRIQSLTVSHRARCTVIEDQLDARDQ